ncbi:hypothetical protein J2T20_002336 [Paenibacillus wynnii]|nr:hypothetical protein [Paenibacillus wynnii]
MTTENPEIDRISGLFGGFFIAYQLNMPGWVGLG